MDKDRDGRERRDAQSVARALWAGSGVLAVVLFACGLLFGDLLGSSNFPPLNATYARVRSYFLGNPNEVRALSFFHLLAAMALLCFTSYLYGWLRRGSERSSGLALAGGATAAVFLLLSALAYRTLAEPSVARDPGLAHALVVFSYLAGGPAFAVPFALPIAVMARSALRGGTPLPRWTGWLGTAAAAVSVLSAAVMLGPMDNSSALYGILLLAAVLGLIWTVLVSGWLARTA